MTTWVSPVHGVVTVEDFRVARLTATDYKGVDRWYWFNTPPCPYGRLHDNWWCAMFMGRKFMAIVALPWVRA